MSVLFCLTLILSFLCWCNGGLTQAREKRSERCGRDYRGMSGGDVKLFVEEFNNTGVYMYKPNEYCSWTFDTGEPETYIMLTTVYFRLEMSDDCIFDYVEISESGDHEFISRYCDWNNVTYISASKNLKITFHSDISYQDKGFEFKYEIKRKDDIDESKCNSVILGSDPGELSGTQSTCFYSLRADEDDVIELDLTQLDFGGRSCDEERIEVFRGLAGQSKPLMTLCSFNSTGFIGIRERNFFISYHHNGNFTSEGFKMAYRFVLDNFPPAPVPPTKPSPVGGDNDCSDRFIDPKNGELTYIAPTYQDNRQCIVVIKNTLLRNHVMEVKFVKFDLEESDNCEFDSLKIMAGEDENSAMLGGSHGKLYCGQELKGRTLTTNGNSLRLEFKTDESLSFYGFKAVIKFVPNKVCKCDKLGTVCVRTGMEKLCVPGSLCSKKCQNGGKCVRHEGEIRCVCRTGFSGDHCTHGEGGLELLEFVKTPEDNELARGLNEHYEECQAIVVDGEVALINYFWTFDGEQIGRYTDSRGFGTEPGGVLRFSKFNDQMEGVYSCIAETESESRIEHFFEYKLVENCPAGIDLGPKDKRVRIGETALFECYAPTAASVVWKRNGRIIDHDHETRFIKMTNNYLRIEQPEKHDAGTYRCEAKSRTGCVSYRDAELTVLNVTPLNSFCGISIHDEVSTKISTGRVADPTAYPWHVVFRGIKKNKQGEHTFCGGSLISQRYVLTAAHCIRQFREKYNQDFGQNSVKMYIGSSDCYGTGGTMRSPATVHVHDKYDDAAYQDSDIALVELSSPVEYTPGIRPVCLQEEEYVEKTFFGRMMMTFGKVAGCGENWRKGRSQHLQEISIPFVDRLDCEDKFEEYRHKPNVRIPNNYRLTDQMFCAGNDVKRTGDACKGDSGGALVMVADYRWIQTGIVSFGMGCDTGNYGVYTNVGKFYDWIKDITNFHLEVIEKN